MNLLKIAALATVVATCAVTNAQTWYIGTTYANSVSQEAAWQTAVGPTPLEDFDNMLVGTPFGNITSVNVTVSTYSDNTQALVWNGGATFTRSGDQFLWNTWHLRTEFVANGTMTAFAYWAAGGDADVHKVTLLDTSNNVMGVNWVTAEPSKPCFFGVTTTANIGKVLVEADGAHGTTQDSIGFDDMQTNAVPEPATCAILATGAAALGRRRAKK